MQKKYIWNKTSFFRKNKSKIALEEELGRGTYGVVRKLIIPGTGDRPKEIAHKQIHSTSAENPAIRNELEIIDRIESARFEFGPFKFVARTIDIEERQQSTSFAMEFCNAGSLEEHVEGIAGSGERIERDTALDFVFQMLLGLRFLGKLNIVHNDLKPENVMMHSTVDDEGSACYVLKLIDFGLSKLLPNRLSCDGTQMYFPPEKIENSDRAQLNEGVDVWGLGVIFHKILTGHEFFNFDQTTREMLRDINLINENIRFKEYFLEDADAWGRDVEALIGKMLHKNPRKRASLMDLFRDPLFRGLREKYRHECVYLSKMEDVDESRPLNPRKSEIYSRQKVGRPPRDSRHGPAASRWPAQHATGQNVRPAQTGVDANKRAY